MKLLKKTITATLLCVALTFTSCVSKEEYARKWKENYYNGLGLAANMHMSGKAAENYARAWADAETDEFVPGGLDTAALVEAGMHSKAPPIAPQVPHLPPQPPAAPPPATHVEVK